MCSAHKGRPTSHTTENRYNPDPCLSFFLLSLSLSLHRSLSLSLNEYLCLQSQSRVCMEASCSQAQLGWEDGNWPCLAVPLSKVPTACLTSLCGSGPQCGFTVAGLNNSQNNGQ